LPSGAGWCRWAVPRPTRSAVILTTLGPDRDHLTAGLYLPADPAAPLARLERAFDLAARAAPVLERVVRASREGRLPAGDPDSLLDAALVQGVIRADEAAWARDAAQARRDVIEVDSFPRA
jgi:acyl-CoA dehydrogenase